MQQEQRPVAGSPLPPPPALGLAVTPAVDRAQLRALAVRHRWAAIGGILNAAGGALLALGAIPPITTLALAAIVVGTVYRLGRHLYGVGIGIVCGAAMLIPLVWIVVVVVLCSQASKRLRAAGVRVGFLGADAGTI